jgi:hypothetical protein
MAWLKSVHKRLIQIHPDNMWPTQVARWAQTVEYFTPTEFKRLANSAGIVGDFSTKGAVVIAGSFPLWLVELHSNERIRTLQWVPNDIDIFCSNVQAFVNLVEKFTTMCETKRASNGQAVPVVICSWVKITRDGQCGYDSGAQLHPIVTHRLVSAIAHKFNWTDWMVSRIWFMVTFPRWDRLVVRGFDDWHGRFSICICLKDLLFGCHINLVVTQQRAASNVPNCAINVMDNFDISVCKVALQLNAQKMQQVADDHVQHNKPVPLNRLLPLCTFFTTDMATVGDIWKGESTVDLGIVVERLNKSASKIGLILPNHYGNRFQIFQNDDDFQQRADNLPENEEAHRHNNVAWCVLALLLHVHSMRRVGSWLGPLWGPPCNKPLHLPGGLSH